MNREKEYTEVNNNLRHYSNLRFAQLTIFLALTGGLIAITFSKDISNKLKTLFEATGIFISLMFLLIEESATHKWKSFKKRGIELEKDLEFSQLINFPSSGLFSATAATRMLYAGVIFFWLIALICGF